MSDTDREAWSNRETLDKAEGEPTAVDTGKLNGEWSDETGRSPTFLESLKARFKKRGEARHASVEFAPDAVEIENRPPPALAQGVLYLLVALLVVALTWASLSEIDEVVSAAGKTATTARVIIVQPLETSIIRAINAREGDVVSAGDVLAELDPTFTEADVGQLKAQVASLGAQAARLTAEMEDRPYAPVVEDQPEAEMQWELFSQRMSHYLARISTFNSKINELNATLRAKQADIAILEEHRDTLTEVEQMRRVLADQKNGSRLNMLEARALRLEVDRDLEDTRNSILELRASLRTAQAEQEAFDREWREKIASELVDTRRELSRAREELSKAERRQDLIALRAPFDGVVLQVAERSVGSIARGVDPLFTLVPIDTELEVEARVRASDVGHIQVGDPVRVKLQAYPFQKYGTLEGRVRTISRDSFSGGRGGEGDGANAPRATPEDQEAFYVIHVDLLTTELSRKPKFYQLIPGMTAIAEIKVGRRTVLSYLLYPIMRGLDESIREP